MMLRRAFLKRMAMAAAASLLIDVPWPKPNESSVLEQIERLVHRFGSPHVLYMHPDTFRKLTPEMRKNLGISVTR